MQKEAEEQEKGAEADRARIVEAAGKLPDCAPAVAYRVWLREGVGGQPLLVYEGSPGGGFSTTAARPLGGARTGAGAHARFAGARAPAAATAP